MSAGSNSWSRRSSSSPTTFAGDDKVAVVAFADRAKVILEPDQIHDKRAVQAALDDIDMLEIGGGTQMALGMQAAIDEVNKGHAPNRLNRVLVLTDGQTYQETACTDLANKYREGMSFSTMGVGVEFNEKLLQRIAQDSNGKYHFIGNPSEIPGLFEDELEGLRAVSVRNGRIDVTLSQGVQVREAFRASPEIYTPRRAAGRRAQDQLPDRRPRSRACPARFFLRWCCRRASPVRCESHPTFSHMKFPASASAPPRST